MESLAARLCADSAGGALHCVLRAAWIAHHHARVELIGGEGVGRGGEGGRMIHEVVDRLEHEGVLRRTWDAKRVTPTLRSATVTPTLRSKTGDALRWAVGVQHSRCSVRARCECRA